MPVQTPDLFWVVAQEVLDCVCVALNDQGDCPCPCRACVVAGIPVWDNCCPDGQLTVYLEDIYVNANFPSQEGGAIFCSTPLSGNYTVQLIRCAPTVKDSGDPPTCEELSHNAQQIYTDFYVASRAVICCLAAYKRHRKFTMRNMRIVGPQGGCVGFEIKFTVELPDPNPTLGGS